MLTDGTAQVSVLSAPAFASGGVIFCDTVTASVAVQPFAVFVTVTVYTFGVLAVGAGIDALFSPPDGDHEYVFPAMAAVPIPILVTVHVSVLFTPASTTGGVMF
jgi:hypothetical protein